MKEAHSPTLRNAMVGLVISKDLSPIDEEEA